MSKLGGASSTCYGRLINEQERRKIKFDNVLEAYHEGEQTKQEILTELSEKINQP